MGKLFPAARLTPLFCLEDALGVMIDRATQLDRLVASLCRLVSILCRDPNCNWVTGFEGLLGEAQNLQSHGFQQSDLDMLTASGP